GGVSRFCARPGEPVGKARPAGAWSPDRRRRVERSPSAKMSIQRSLPAWIAALALAFAATAARADQKGEEVLGQAFKTLGAAKSYSADMTASMTAPGAPGALTFKGTVKAMKPNYLRVEMKGEQG